MGYRAYQKRDEDIGRDNRKIDDDLPVWSNSKTIGEKMGISPETVRQIEKRAIRKLKEHAHEVKDYIYT